MGPRMVNPALTTRLACETADACDKLVAEFSRLCHVHMECTQPRTHKDDVDSSIGRIMCVSTASSIRDTQSDRRRRTLDALQSLASKFVEFFMLCIV